MARYVFTQYCRLTFTPREPQPCALSEIKLPGGKTYSCPERCTIPRCVYSASLCYPSCQQFIFCSDQDHETHSCDTRLCPATCELCTRLCDKPHLHGVERRAHHLCGSVFVCSASGRELNDSSTREEHSCSALCSAPGTCQIDTSPQSVEATFTGRHETYQYTKVISVLVISVIRFSVVVMCYPVHSRFVFHFTLGHAM